MGTFHKMANQKSIIGYEDFRVALDIFAEMETDDVDIEFEIKKTVRKTPSHSRNNSSVSPMAPSPLNRIPESVELSKAGSGIMEELAEEMKKMKSTESENDSIPDPI